MAQLRDSKTSEVIFEGTPTECVLLARKLGEDEVLYDDVGAGFDPDAVLKVHEEEAKSKNAKAQEAVASKAVGDAQARLTEARDRTED